MGKKGREEEKGGDHGKRRQGTGTRGGGGQRRRAERKGRGAGHPVDREVASAAFLCRAWPSVGAMTFDLAFFFSAMLNRIVQIPYQQVWPKRPKKSRLEKSQKKKIFIYLFFLDFSAMVNRRGKKKKKKKRKEIS